MKKLVRWLVRMWSKLKYWLGITPSQHVIVFDPDELPEVARRKSGQLDWLKMFSQAEMKQFLNYYKVMVFIIDNEIERVKDNLTKIGTGKDSHGYVQREIGKLVALRAIKNAHRDVIRYIRSEIDG